MNAVIALCHFCELHGPSVLISTQAFHELLGESSENNYLQLQQKKLYGNIGNIKKLMESYMPSNICEACQSLNLQHLGYISNDHESRTSYVSTRLPIHTNVASMVHQACIRSLSCEVSPGKEGPVFFGDDLRGHVLSHTFFLKDAHARGFHRWFSIIIVMKDKLFLLNSWPFLVKNVEAIIEQLQIKANKVYEKEQSICPQRSLRLSTITNHENSLQNNQYTKKHSRSVLELTTDNNIFTQLHWWFIWLLKSGGNHLVERFMDVMPVLEETWDENLETEEGFTLISTPQLYHSTIDQANDVSHEENCIEKLRKLREKLGPQNFLKLAYGLVVGHQIIIRGQPQELVASIINTMKVLVPRSCFNAVLHSEEYIDGSYCNLLGLDMWTAAPQPNSGVLRLDILPSHSVCYKLTWGSKLPAKCPTFLMKIEKALENNKLNNDVVESYIVSLKEEWQNMAKIIHRVHSLHGQSQDTTNLLQSLGVQDQDKPLLDFWSKIDA